MNRSPSSPMLTQSLSPSSGFSAKSRCRNNHGSRDLGKRALDIAGASLLTLALLPVLLLLLGMLRATQPSAIYRHKRVGLRGRTFDCLKLRTMHMDGDRILAELLEADPEAQREWATNRKLKNDPRITPIGRFLRKTSLDELPQLLNVLRGEMSLVGPRPVVARELDEHYGPEGTDLYCSVRPGLTGLWQVSGRSDTSYRQRVELDARYVRERSLGLDVKILLRTPVAVLRRDGAC